MFSQILKLVACTDFESIVKATGAQKGAKGFSSWSQFVAMLFYLVSSPGEPLTRAETIEFSRLSGLSLVLPRRPAHWRTLLDETARSKGFTLRAAVEADSLRVQKELVAGTAGIYSLLGSPSIADELDSGRVQAARIINPELRRYVTLALPKQGRITPAGRIVSKLIAECASDWNREIANPDASSAHAKTRTKR